MDVTLWGVRGSVPSPGLNTVRYGGNTACVEVRGAGGGTLILDAGTGIRRLGEAVRPAGPRLDILLTHLHLDHVQGLGFFGPLDAPDLTVHIWGPAARGRDLRSRLAQYLSPPLSPVRLGDFLGRLMFHEVPAGRFEVAGFEVVADYVCHPGPTVGYRIVERDAALCYLPDHEPALASGGRFDSPEWTSGFDLVKDAALLIHDAQYTAEEYSARRGWGHSTLPHAIALARLAGARQLVAFHHDPGHDDATLDRLLTEVDLSPPLRCVAGREGMRFAV
jgi:phosphoribosyl 1,2-cyclic phosphodiesterase